MRGILKTFYPFVIATIGQGFLLGTLVVTFPGDFVTVIIEPGIILVRTIALLVGLAILSFILVKFIGKYIKHPSLARLNVLLALIAFLIATTAYLVSTSFQFPQHEGARIVDRFFTDTTNLFLVVGAFMFLVFGTTFFMGTMEQGALETFKNIMNVIASIIIACFVTGKLIAFFQPGSAVSVIFDDVTLYAVLAFGMACLVLLLVIAIRALALTGKTEDLIHKRGLKALGISYIFLFCAIVTLILNILVFDEMKELILVAIGLLCVGFIFVHEGFVKPTSSK